MFRLHFLLFYFYSPILAGASGDGLYFRQQLMREVSVADGRPFLRSLRRDFAFPVFTISN